MPYSFLKIIFPEKTPFVFKLGADITVPIPEWAYFNNNPCPGNILHGPNIDHCRLAHQITPLVEYFVDINSFDKGHIILFEKEVKETKIYGDAQNLFFHAFWTILAKAQCSIFEHDRHLRENYMTTSDINRMFYTFFSIFLVDSYSKSPLTVVDITPFKNKITLMSKVLEFLIDKFRNEFQCDTDSTINGLVLFDNLLHVFEYKFKDFLSEINSGID